MGLGIGAIGGKDSMSGSFEKLDVPPTLVSFATAIGHTQNVCSAEFKAVGSNVVLLSPVYTDGCVPDLESQKQVYAAVENLMAQGNVRAAASVGFGGVAEAIFKMGLGNRIGFALTDSELCRAELFRPLYGSFVLELADGVVLGRPLGKTIEDYRIEAFGEHLNSAWLQEVWERKLEPVFPYRKAGDCVETLTAALKTPAAAPKVGVAKPKVIIPVFPGTNCEYDTARAFRRAGAEPQVLVINNMTPAAVAESCQALVKAIRESQIVMLPGGFSGGDEPDGSAKFIAAFFRAPAVTEAVRELLQKRDGLMLGICNGFQALVKLGLLPYGDIRPIAAEDPTLTFNTIGRHQSMLVRTRIAAAGSPWLARCKPGEVYTVAVSHGEGRFVAPEKALRAMLENGQVATQYVDLDGNPTMDLRYDPNGSVLAIEGITSPDGRIFGKMGHAERCGDALYKNVPGKPGEKEEPIFASGVDYFRL